MAASVVAVAGMLAFTAAHEGATDVVRERMALMKDIGNQQKILVHMLKGSLPFDAEAARKAARAIASHAEKLPQLFPEGSDEGVSEASPRIWQDWEAFETSSVELGERAHVLASKARQAAGPADIRDALVAMVRTCASCHSDFRVRK